MDSMLVKEHQGGRAASDAALRLRHHARQELVVDLAEVLRAGKGKIKSRESPTRSRRSHLFMLCRSRTRAAATADLSNRFSRRLRWRWDCKLQHGKIAT